MKLDTNTNKETDELSEYDELELAAELDEYEYDEDLLDKDMNCMEFYIKKHYDLIYAIYHFRYHLAPAYDGTWQDYEARKGPIIITDIDYRGKKTDYNFLIYHISTYDLYYYHEMKWTSWLKNKIRYHEVKDGLLCFFVPYNGSCFSCIYKDDRSFNPDFRDFQTKDNLKNQEAFKEFINIQNDRYMVDSFDEDPDKGRYPYLLMPTTYLNPIKVKLKGYDTLIFNDLRASSSNNKMFENLYIKQNIAELSLLKLFPKRNQLPW